MPTSTGGFAPLPRRLVKYSEERFPLGTYGTGALLFGSSASLIGEAIARPSVRIGWGDIAVLTTIVLVFFHLRLMDELKDAELDALFRPERPLPRGLVSPHELRLLGLSVIALELALNVPLGLPTLGLYAVVVIFSGLMYVEFWAGAWLRQHLMIYSATHMLILPLLAAYAYVSHALRADIALQPRFIFFLLLSYVAGFLLEVSRKVRAPQSECDGIDTFSKQFGVTGVSILMASLAALVGFTSAPLSAAIEPRWPALVAIGLLCLIGATGILRYRLSPCDDRARRVAVLYGPLTAVGVYVVFLLQIALHRSVTLSSL